MRLALSGCPISCLSLDPLLTAHRAVVLNNIDLDSNAVVFCIGLTSLALHCRVSGH